MQIHCLLSRVLTRVVSLRLTAFRCLDVLASLFRPVRRERAVITGSATAQRHSAAAAVAMSTAAVMPLPLPDFVLSSAAGRLLTDLFAKSLSSFTTVTLLLLACELVLNALIVEKVPYTEIDWQAYVDEVEGVIVRLSLGMLDHPSASPHPSLPRTSCSSQQPICCR